MDTGENNDNNKASKDDNTEAKMEEGKEKDSDDEKEEEKKKTAKPDDYFTMSIVNGYGSQVLRNLVDDDAPLKLNSKCVCVCARAPHVCPCVRQHSGIQKVPGSVPGYATLVLTQYQTTVA